MAFRTTPTGTTSTASPNGFGPMADAGPTAGGGAVPMMDDAGPMGDDAIPGQGTSLGVGNVSASGSGQWPLIADLLADSVYCNAYADIMQGLIDSGPLTVANFNNKVTDYGNRVAGYTSGSLSFDMESRIAVLRASIPNRTTICP